MNAIRIRVLFALLASLAALILLQAVALADDLTIPPYNGPLLSMQLTGVYGPSYGGVDLSPYLITVNGIPAWLTCNDYFDDMGFDTWIAEKFSGSDTTSLLSTDFINDSETAWAAAGVTLDPLFAYNEDAYLKKLLYANLSNYDDEAIYSFAIWELFDPSASAGGYQAAVTAALGDASVAATANPHLRDSLIIYDPVTYRNPSGCSVSNGNLSCTNWGSGEVQQFEGLSEPSSLAVLAFELFALLGGIFLVRRRLLA